MVEKKPEVKLKTMRSVFKNEKWFFRFPDSDRMSKKFRPRQICYHPNFAMVSTPNGDIETINVLCNAPNRDRDCEACLQDSRRKKQFPLELPDPRTSFAAKVVIVHVVYLVVRDGDIFSIKNPAPATIELSLKMHDQLHFLLKKSPDALRDRIGYCLQLKCESSSNWLFEVCLDEETEDPVETRLLRHWRRSIKAYRPPADEYLKVSNRDMQLISVGRTNQVRGKKLLERISKICKAGAK